MPETNKKAKWQNHFKGWEHIQRKRNQKSILKTRPFLLEKVSLLPIGTKKEFNVLKPVERHVIPENIRYNNEQATKRVCCSWVGSVLYKHYDKM